MRYVLYVAIALAVASVWLNNSHHGSRIKRELSDHPAEPASLY